MKTIKASADNPLPMPPHGGNWTRQKDGSLKLESEPAPKKTGEPEPEPPADAGGATQPKE